MNAYVWRFISNVNGDGSYHEGGGVLIVAANLTDAKKAIPNTKPEEYQDIGKPDHVLPLFNDEHKELVVIFPNAGCC